MPPAPPEDTSSAAPPPATWPHRLLRTLVTVPLALWVFLEEWVWNSILAFMRWLGKLPPVHWLETQVARLPPYAALIVFAVPGIILLPFKFGALYLIAHGHRFYGLMVFVVAKLIGTALLSRIFSLTKPALMTIGWFSRFYAWFDAWKQKLYAYVREMPAYQALKARARALREAARAWWRKRTGTRKWDA